MSPFTSCTVGLLLAALFAAPLVADAQTPSFGSGTAVGVTIQAIGSEEGIAEIPALGLHITSIKPSGFAVDVTLATLPTAVAYGLLLLAPDVSVGYVIPVGGGGLMIKGGLSGVVVATGMGGGFAGGVHVGAAAFVRLGPNFGLRAEIVPRLYGSAGGGAQLTTFGIGFTSLPSRPR